MIMMTMMMMIIIIIIMIVIIIIIIVITIRGGFLEEKMKLNVSKEYIGRLRKVLKSKLNGGNLVHGVNTWAVFLLRCSAAFVSWRKSRL